MLPNILESTYKRYKYDTSTFIKWLFKSGQACGYASKTPAAGLETQDENVPAKVPRLKGKARMQAKKTPSAAPSTKSKDTHPEQKLVDLKELLPLVKAITKQANKGHNYFISLMEEVIMALQPCFAVRTAAAAVEQDVVPSRSIEDLENRFASLEIEEPLENTGAEESNDSNVSVGPVYDIEPPKTEKQIEEENLFALFCLFDDLQRLRSFIQKLWASMPARSISSLPLSQPMQLSSWQFARRTRFLWHILNIPCSQIQGILAAVMNAYAVNSHQDLELEIDDSVIHWMFAPAHNILDSFCAILQPKEVPLIKRGNSGVYDPRANIQRQREDMVLLLEILPEFAFI
ncbi:uncharacterized protein LY89DRAFT_735960 [Mollisia scopiformis]|uniref:DUF6604 domain-containing protein n=1 Tax=Mollisia scopiformis TaxID=149040 RepID=A0A194X4B9_MOLSC|nr:uncharacterized protein LY89DRAFT_735960 [Mollisia scopiformis]KUJ14899.1 hypothetical protein LY89DRAFT_735960 [Mollisia scopiformis]